MKKIVTSVIIILIVGAIVAGLFLFKKHPVRKMLLQVTPVEIQPVKLVNAPTKINAVGTLVASQQIDVSSETNGQVEKVFFKEGQLVKEGDVLLQLDDVKSKAEALSSKAAYEFTKSKYERAAKLIKNHYVSQQDIDAAKSDLQAKLAAAQESENDLQKKTICAPFAGYLGKKTINIGDYVTAGQKIVELVDRSQLKVDYSVSENHLSQLRLGQKVAVVVDALPGKVFYGAVSFIAPAVDYQTHTVSLQATIPNQDNLLAPGLFAKIEQLLDQQNEVAIVPEQSIVKTLEKTIVYKVVNNKAVATEVKIGTINNGNVEVLSGLAKDDIVVTSGQDKLKDGAQVKIVGS